MFITCQQCSTMFRLDENRLKPQGSKVRCSQCGNLFIAKPPEEAVAQPPVYEEVVAQVEPSSASPAAEDRELEGIDLAELDSILEKDSPADVTGDRLSLDSDEELVEFNEADLDFDFESALEVEDEPVAQEAAAETQPADDELDLDMDFNLEDGDTDQAVEEISEAAMPEDSALEPAAGSFDQPEAQLQEGEGTDAAGGDLTEDIELPLDDFEDALSLTDDTDVETGDGDLAAADSDIQDGDLGLDDLDNLGSFLDEEPAAPEQERQEVELSLDDDAGLSVAAKDTTPPESVEATDDLGLDDLDALLGEDETTVEQEREEVELSLDDDLDLSLGAEARDTSDAATVIEDGDLSLSGDLNLEPEEKEVGADAAAEALALDDLGDLDGLLDEDEPALAEPENEETELSLADDLDFSLEQDKASAAPPAASEAQDDDLDLSDFDSLLDEADDSGEALAGELDLSLDDDSASGAPATDESAVADEDLLELDLDEGPEDEDLPDQDSDELELSLDLDDDSEDIAHGGPDEEIGELEELEFELDAEFEDKPVSQTAGSAGAPEEEDLSLEEEELDLTDIEQMLEDDTIVPDVAGDSAGVDDDDDSKRWAGDDEDDLGMDDGELDLTEIEEAIDAADSELEDNDNLDIEEEDLDLDLNLESEPAEAESTPEPEELELKLEMETSPRIDQADQEDVDVLDMSDLDFSLEDESPSKTTETIDAGDIELEFEIEDDGASADMLSGEDTLVASKTTTAVANEAENELDADDFSLDETVTAQPVLEKPPATPVKAPPKKGPGKSLVVLLILAILGGGGYFGYDYVIKNDIQIPYLSDYINPKPKDPSGISKLSTLEINSKFIENQKAGRLFVVTGKVRNGYTVPCTMIRLRGKLFTKGKVLAKTAQSYAGITITDQELVNQELPEIMQRLKSPLAQAKSVQVAPGQTAPFMVVFSDLPDDLDEFAIELVSSTKVQ